MTLTLDLTDVLECLLVLFSLNHSHGKLSILLKLSSVDGHAVGVSWKWPIFIKISGRKLIWQYRLMFVLNSMLYFECCVGWVKVLCTHL